ncbi:hypothetical protein Tco_1265899 [Tanacetum coccineum]
MRTNLDVKCADISETPNQASRNSDLMNMHRPETTTPSQQELDLLFGPLYDEFFNVGTLSVNKSSSPTDNFAQQDTQPSTNIHPTTEPITPTPTITAEENNDNQTTDT